MPAQTFEVVMQRMDDPVYPHRFDNEKSALMVLQVLSQRGFIQQPDMITILQVYGDYLSSKGY